jgi:hypothetical protein
MGMQHQADVHILIHIWPAHSDAAALQPVVGSLRISGRDKAWRPGQGLRNYAPVN